MGFAIEKARALGNTLRDDVSEGFLSTPISTGNRVAPLIANRLILTNALWMIAEKGLRLVLGIIVVGLVARHLGTEMFGQLNFAVAVLAISGVVASAGMNRIVPREVVGAILDSAARSEIISTVFFIRLSAAFVIIVLLFVTAYLFTSQDITLLFLVVVSLLLNPFDTIDLHQQGIAQVKYIALIRSCVFVLSSLIKIGLVFVETPAIWFFAAVLVEHAIVAVCFYVLILNKNGKEFLTIRRCRWGKARSLLRESWPEVLAGLGGILFLRLDLVMLQFMEGAESVGIYSAAVRISEAWYFFPMAIISSTFPKIVQLRQSSAERYQDSLLILLSALVGISLVAGALFYTFSGNIVGLVFGPSFSESALILQIHCLVALFIFLGSASGSWLAAERKLVWNLQRNLFGLVMNVFFNLMLIERYGAPGAAFATLISVVCAYYLFDLLSPKLRFMFVLKSQAVLTLGIWGAIRARKYALEGRVL